MVLVPSLDLKGYCFKVVISTVSLTTQNINQKKIIDFLKKI